VIMKTKFLLISMCLLLGIAVIPANAQKPLTVQGWWTSFWYGPVYCDDVEVDFLIGGEIRIHTIMQFHPNKTDRRFDQIKGEVTSETGETFQIRGELDKYYYFEGTLFLECHVNLIGDAGTHYIESLIINMDTWPWEITVVKTVCHCDI
jgi:hypothetical protein